MTTRTDDGFSILELVIAMLLFAVIAVAILPLAIQAASLSVVNRDNVEANSFASAQLALVRTGFPDAGANSCTLLQDETASSIPDPAQTGLTADVTVDPTCPATFPGVVTVTVDVFDLAESASEPVVTMKTQIVVTTS